MYSTPRLLVGLAAASLSLATAAPASAAITTIVGGTTLNGDFNDESLGTGPAGAFEQTFAQTLNWENIGGAQTVRATRNNNPRVDGTRNALVDDGTTSIFGLDTGYTIVDGDIFNLSYQWRDANNWADGSDQIGVTLFTTDDDAIGGVRTNLFQSLSGLSVTNNAFQDFAADGFYTAGATEAGKNLFVELNGVDGNSGANAGVARLDNFVLSVGVEDPPPGPAPSSVLTGVNLFSDTFDRPDTTGLDLDSSTAGMSSDVFTQTANTTYAEFDATPAPGPEAVIEGGKMALAKGSGQTYAGIDRNFVDQEILDDAGFAVEAIVDPKTGDNGDDTDRYVAIGVGLSQANATTPTTGAGADPLTSDDDVQILEQAALAFAIFDDGTYAFYDSFALTDTTDGNAPADENRDIFGSGEYIGEAVDGKQDFLSQIGQVIDDEYKLRLEYSLDDFNLGSSVTLHAYIQDVKIDLDTTDGIEANPEDRDGYTFTWDGANQNYIAFEGRAQSTSTFDALLIETLLSDVLAGDANSDGVVDLLDFDVLAQNFGSSTGNGAADGDFNGDGAVDLLDFDILAQNFGATSPGAVPEPASLALLGLGGTALLRRRRA